MFPKPISSPIGIPRTTKAEVAEGNFALFDNPKGCYSTFNLHYTSEVFDNLSKLVEFNTALNEDLIKDNMAECVRKRRRLVESS